MMISCEPPGVCDVTQGFFRWLTNEALPLWSTTGVDVRNGGFIERLTPDGQPIGDVRRARLVARQIFAFKAAAELGWTGPADSLVRHGLTALLQHHLAAGSEVIPRYIPAEERQEGDFDLYDHAFVLFGLAHGYAWTGDEQLEALALSILSRLRKDWGLEEGGFAEHRRRRAPLKANPHMHLLEASLAWMGVSTDAAWARLRAEIVELCLTRFIERGTGSLHEFFDTDWSILTGDADVIEPGHQAEWAWLLLQCPETSADRRSQAAAARLQEIAEREGLDSTQQRLINELNADLSPRDRRARLWPQTERIKALVAFHEREAGENRRLELAGRLARSVEALLGYFDHPVAGSWWEHFDGDGRPVAEAARASSLYHIMGAAKELARVTGERLG